MAKKTISGKVIQYNDNTGQRSIGLETKAAVEAKDGKKGIPAERTAISSTNNNDLPVVSVGDTVKIEITVS